MEAAQTTAATTQAPTAVTAESMLTWTQMGGTAPADQGSYRMTTQSLVMVRKNYNEWISWKILSSCVMHAGTSQI